MFNLEKLQQKINSLTDKRKFLIAYSGGMDSHVLLHSFSFLAKQNSFQLRAVHINHGLSANAAMWVEHCHFICNELNVEFIVKNIDIAAHLAEKHSLEAIARKFRYQEFENLLTKDECLVTAHHADDQAETLFLQLFRGSGIKGLSAMPECRKFGGSFLLRPLLFFTREDLAQYACAHKLNWIEDESNENIGLDRNFVRHKLITTIKERWPTIAHTLLRVTNNCAEADKLLTCLGEQDYQNILGSKANTISIAKILQLDEFRQRNVIRFWLAKLQLPIPSKVKILHIQSNILRCERKDANPIVHWHGGEVRTFKGDLYAFAPQEEFATDLVIPWNGKKDLVLPNNLGVLTPLLLQQHGIKVNLIKKPITVRFRGSAFAKDKHHLKNFFQKHAIPVWLRNQVPIIYVDDKLSLIVLDSC